MYGMRGLALQAKALCRRDIKQIKKTSFLCTRNHVTEFKISQSDAKDVKNNEKKGLTNLLILRMCDEVSWIENKKRIG